MTDVTIPAEVREAVAKAIYEHWRSVMMQSPPWEEVDEDWRNGTLGQAEAGITALFLSWPDRHTKLFPNGQHHIIIPLAVPSGALPTEASDDR